MSITVYSNEKELQLVKYCVKFSFVINVLNSAIENFEDFGSYKVETNDVHKYLKKEDFEIDELFTEELVRKIIYDFFDGKKCSEVVIIADLKIQVFQTSIVFKGFWGEDSVVLRWSMHQFENTDSILKYNFCID